MRNATGICGAIRKPTAASLNWLSNFGGKAWTFDDRTGQYYYHAFLPEQPDLNWRNADVRQAMLDAMRFWFDRGVDGFRVDVIYKIVKDSEFRDNPANPAYVPAMAPHHVVLAVYNADRPEVHDIIAEMRALADSYTDRLLIGEIYLPVERLITYYGTAGGGVHLPFNFQLLLLPWNAQTIANAVASYEAALPAHGWPNWVLGNHDKRGSRPASDKRRAGSRRCWCSLCAARRLCIMATNWECATCRLRMSVRTTRSKSAFRKWDSAATRSARRCNGKRVPTPDSVQRNRGSRSHAITRVAT